MSASGMPLPASSSSSPSRISASSSSVRGSGSSIEAMAYEPGGDPDDDYLLGCAAAGAADDLVTGDEDLLALRQHRDVAIVEARTFLAVLAAEQG